MAFKIDFDFEVQEKLTEIVDVLGFDHIDPSKIVCMQSKGSKANAYARIWSLEKAWQIALNLEPHYIIEVLAEKYGKLSEEEKEKTLIHELLHIPKIFSGNLVPHKCFGKRMMTNKRVNEFYKSYKSNKKTTSAEQLKLGIKY